MTAPNPIAPTATPAPLLFPPPAETATPVALVLQEPQGPPAGGEGGGEDAPGSPFSSILFPLAVMAILFWVIMLGPERKQRKKREAMLAALKKGDRVVTTSGLHGTVATVSDDLVTLQVADGVRLKFSRAAVQSVVDDGSGEKAEKGEKAGQGAKPAEAK